MMCGPLSGYHRKDWVFKRHAVPLEEYARKRSFDKTPEPGPEAPSKAAGHLFCVQRHDARRLHYDLRIEVGGTLKSWAVPQGPSLDPADKRLAVMVEDHPLEYATFEGNIPKGNYGAGSMMLWDYGWWEPYPDKTPDEMIAKGDFKFTLHGEKLKGQFVLAHMKTAAGKGNDWLLIKKKDAEARPAWQVEEYAWSVKTGRTQEEIAQDLPARREAKLTANPEEAPEGSTAAPMPTGIGPMLATLTEMPPSGPGWMYEVKWDGVRAMCFIENGTVRVAGRKGNDITRQYPELSVVPHQVRAATAVLDGEIAAVDENGRPSFERIQPRIMASDVNAIAQMSRTRPVVFFAFDLLYWNGHDLRGAKLGDRRRLMERIVESGKSLRLSETFHVDPRELMHVVKAQGLEGIVAKRESSRYDSSRSREWLKIKAIRQQEFVICGYTIGERDHFGALVLGIWDAGEFLFAGSVGTGFDQKLMKQIRERLDALRPATCPFEVEPSLPQQIIWTRPELVATVKYLEWTNEGRLRAPVFAGLRDDIDPRDCTRRETEPDPAARPPLFSPDASEETITVEGHRFQIKNLKKVFYPGEGITKRDVIEYYDAAADLLIPHWKDRPLSLRRYPDGITKEGFFQKNSADSKFPEWLRQETLLAEDGKMRKQVIGDGRAALVYLANLGCIDQNPWMSRIGSLDNPDFLLIDLDPHECGFERIVEAAQLVRRMLDEVGLKGYAKTTGGDGMHVYVPLDPVYTYEQTRAFAEIIARLATRQRPDLFTMPRAVGRREKDRVYFDYVQNARGKTISAPYVLRAYPGAPVATPLDWTEVKRGLDPKQFHIRNAMARFASTGDLFAPVLQLKQRLETALERMDRLARA